MLVLGRLAGRELKLVLNQKHAGDPAGSHAPACRFKMTPFISRSLKKERRGWK
jgi:hypothetical protein